MTSLVILTEAWSKCDKTILVATGTSAATSLAPARRREGHVTAGPADPAIQRPVIERVAGPDDDPAHRQPVMRTAHAQPGNSSAHVRGADPRDQPSPCTPMVRWPRVKNVSPPGIFFSLAADGRGQAGESPVSARTP
jgi:hypothetical protein